jgi:hypothetical protein
MLFLPQSVYDARASLWPDFEGRAILRRIPSARRTGAGFLNGYETG